jgi:uncharacterized protein YcbX
VTPDTPVPADPASGGPAPAPIGEGDGLPCRVAGLFVHPVKSCAGIAVSEALVVETGFDLDRTWMVVDAQGEMLTQRELPRMALVSTALRGNELVLRAPGMLALHVRVDTVEAPTRVRVWDDVVKAYDMGGLAAQWFTDFLRPRSAALLRLARFDPEEKRPADAKWSAGVAAETAFSDGFPLLVASNASLAELNARLAARGQAPVTMARFRPNIVLDGLQAFDEDNLSELVIGTDEGPVHLRLTKPCVRCSIPNLDPSTATVGHEPGDTLAGFRADARMGGGITFGMNAVVAEGFDRSLRVGQTALARWAF